MERPAIAFSAADWHILLKRMPNLIKLSGFRIVRCELKCYIFPFFFCLVYLFLSHIRQLFRRRIFAKCSPHLEHVFSAFLSLSLFHGLFTFVFFIFLFLFFFFGISFIPILTFWLKRKFNLNVQHFFMLAQMLLFKPVRYFAHSIWIS